MTLLTPRYLFLSSSLLLSTDSLQNSSTDILTDLLRYTGGHVLGDILEDGSSRNTGLGHDSVSYRDGSGVAEAEEGLGFSISLSLANVCVSSNSGNLDLSTDWVLMSLEGLTDHHRFCGAVRLNVTALTNHLGLGDDLADW